MPRPANEYAVPEADGAGARNRQVCAAAALCLARRPEPRRRANARVLTSSNLKPGKVNQGGFGCPFTTETPRKRLLCGSVPSGAEEAAKKLRSRCVLYQGMTLVVPKR